MSLQVSLKIQTNVPVEVEGVTPDVVREMPLDDIQQLTAFHGNQKMALAELFEVSGDASDGQINWHGDLSGVHWIGAKMSSGSVVVHGNAGRHVGSEMRGGTIEVNGNAGDWVGGEMKGGQIHVHGSAGHLVGAAYRGSSKGMSNGTILIRGGVGNELGHTIRRGLVVVGGDAGDLVGFNMLAGTILVLGNCGIRHGAGMRRGTIGLLGEEQPRLLPSFRFGCRYQPGVMMMLLRDIVRRGFEIPEELFATTYDVYHGDLIEGGRGEILLRP